MSPERCKGTQLANIPWTQRGTVRMTTTSIGVQELRKRIREKAKADPRHRFWGLYTHVWKLDVLGEAYCLAKKNNGAPPEAKERRASLDHMEHAGDLRRLEIVIRLPERLVQCAQGLSPITLLSELAGNAGWRKSPCPVCRAGAGTTGYGLD